ncbi:kinesin-like protein KIN-14C [Glycine soja]|uniref:kinesin-like protein KIN-14C n=1 Tax=Glycine soja TaxID=3848 RepID=UPI00103CBBC2|nr:kinesin-like protein KIN-14C [Glycine soja]
MNSPPDDNNSEPRELGSPDASSNEIENFLSLYGEVEAKHRLLLVQWLTSLVPSLNLPINVTDGELRACLSNGTVLCQILNKLRHGTVNVVSEPDNFLPSQSENVKSFLKALDGMGLPRFEISDLEKGSMKAVVDCLLTLREKSLQNALGDNISVTNSNTVSPHGNAPFNFHCSPTFGGEQRKIAAGSMLQRVNSTPIIMAEPSVSLIHHVGHKFHEEFQLKPGSYADLPAAKISEMMKSNSIDNAPTQSLLSVVNGILEESVERRNGEIPHRVACLLKKVTQEIERRMSTQAEHLRTQNNLFKAREEKYQSRIRVLEALASGTRDESEICSSQVQQFKGEMIKEEEKKVDENEVVRLIKEQEDKNLEISALKVELETAKRTCEVQFSQLEEEANGFKATLTRKVQEYEHQLEELRNEAEKIKEEVKTTDEKETIRIMKEQEDKKLEISSLKKKLETKKKTYEVECSQFVEEAKDAKQKAQEYENQLKALRNKVEKIKEEVKTENENEIVRLMKEQEDKNLEISALKQELEKTKRTYEVQRSQLETEAKDAKVELTQKSREYEHRLEELRNKAEKIREEEKEADEKEIIRLMKEQEDKNLEISTLEQKSREYEHRLDELRNKIKELEVSSDSKDQKWNMKMNQIQTVINFQLSSLQKLELSWECIKQNVMKEQTVYAEDCDRLGVYLKPLLHAAENYHTLLAENQKMFNEIQELKGNIRVYCRIRPFLSGKKEKQSIVKLIGENDLVVANPSKEGKDALRSFKFNKVFGSATTQAEVYSDIQSFIRSVLDGYNVCIFAYGQTGSGKTYTMTGPNGATSETIGVNYRALNDLFKIATSRESLMDYEIGVQMVEIYNEQVRDLLITDGSPKRTLGILTRPQPKGLAVPDASLFPVKSPSDVIKLMDIGLKNRAIGATAMNERSSRSHSVVSIHIRGKDLKTGSTMVGNLHLVDLAGSERVDRSEVTGDRLKEAQHINRSLSALGDVIFALSQKSPHVPYRNSKLTQLLQTSLGDQAKTLMFVQINSDVSSYSETLSTLKFAERVSGVELGAARSSKESKDVRELMEQVSSLKNAIFAKEEEIERLQLLKGSVGSIVKRNQISRSRSIKHYEAFNQQPMDDHIHQNEFLHQSELHEGNIGKNIAAIAETSRFTDSDFDEKSSDLSDSAVAPGTETDGSENSSLTERTTSSDKRSKPIRKTIQVMRKLNRTSSIATTPVKDPLKKSPGIKKSVSIGNLKPPKLWK